MIRVFHGQNDILIPFELGTKTNMADRLSFAYLYGYLQKIFTNFSKFLFGIHFKIFLSKFDCRFWSEKFEDPANNPNHESW